jgi:hypothetical protein
VPIHVRISRAKIVGATKRYSSWKYNSSGVNIKILDLKGLLKKLLKDLPVLSIFIRGYTATLQVGKNIFLPPPLILSVDLSLVDSSLSVIHLHGRPFMPLRPEA